MTTRHYDINALLHEVDHKLIGAQNELKQAIDAVRSAVTTHAQAEQAYRIAKATATRAVVAEGAKMTVLGDLVAGVVAVEKAACLQADGDLKAARSTVDEITERIRTIKYIDSRHGGQR